MPLVDRRTLTAWTGGGRPLWKLLPTVTARPAASRGLPVCGLKDGVEMASSGDCLGYGFTRSDSADVPGVKYSPPMRIRPTVPFLETVDPLRDCGMDSRSHPVNNR